MITELQIFIGLQLKMLLTDFKMEEDKNIVDKIMDDTVEAIVEIYGEVKPELEEYLDKLRKQYTIIYESKEIFANDVFCVLTRESLEIEKNRHSLLYQMKRLLEFNQKLIEKRIEK